MSNTYIYVISSDDFGPVKIGYSKTPEKRLKQLQTAQANKLKLHYIHETTDDTVKSMEKTIHDQLRTHKKKGEWFDVPVNEAILEIQYAFIRWK